MILANSSDIQRASILKTTKLFNPKAWESLTCYSKTLFSYKVWRDHYKKRNKLLRVNVGDSMTPSLTKILTSECAYKS